MQTQRTPRIESLEKRLALAVTATVTDGDLIVQGDADGAVEIVAVGAGSYEVRDNGNVIADGSTLTGVTDDVRISIDAAAGVDNTVSLDLNGQTVDQVFARLGNGTNTLQVSNGSAANFVYMGGSGADSVTLGTEITGNAQVRLGSGDNSLTVSGTVNNLSVRGGSGADVVTIAAGALITSHLGACLGNGANSLTVNGSVGGNLMVGGGDGADVVTLADTSAIADSVFLRLGGGDNLVAVAGSIGGSLRIDGRDGNDAITIAASGNIADSFFARLGAGDNTVTHDGTVGGDFNVESSNASDTVTIAETAVVGGETNLGLGEQEDGGCGQGRGHHHALRSPEGANQSTTSAGALSAAAKPTTASAAARGLSFARLLRRR